MTSLMARIEAARQAPLAPAPPALPMEAIPVQAPPAPRNDSVESRGVQAMAENDVMSYMLNPPLPKAGHVEPPPMRETRTTTPRPRPHQAVVRVRRTARPIVEPKIRIPRKPKEKTTMKNVPAIYARVTTQPMSGHVANTPTPDPEGCLAWLEYLSKNVHPAALHLLLAYYRRLGWIPTGTYGWLRDLCDGIARQNRNVTWDTLRIGPDQLIKVHAQSYRWLTTMFPRPKASAHAANGNGALVTVKSSPRRARSTKGN